MRWQLTMQLVVGLAALFGVGYLAIDHYVEPPGEILLQRTSSAEAASAASDAALEWEKMKSIAQRLARSAAENPILATLGSQFPSGEPRQKAIRSALEALVAQAGTDGQAVLTNTQGAVIASAGESGGLSKSAAVKDAALGATSVRFDLQEGQGRLVAAAPITAPGGSSVSGVIVIASPIDNQRLSHWTGTASLVLAVGKDVIATTLAGKKAAQAAAPDAGAVVDIDGEKYATSGRELVDDAGAVVRAIGVAKHDHLTLAGIKSRVQFMVLAFGAFSILLAVAVMMMSPLRPTVEVRSEQSIVTTTDLVPTKQADAEREPDTFFDDSALFDSRIPPPVMPPSLTPPQPMQRTLLPPQMPSPNAPLMRNDTKPLPPRKNPSQDLQLPPRPTQSTHGTPAIEPIPLPSRGGPPTGGMQRPYPGPEPPMRNDLDAFGSPPSRATPASAFDAIAAAAMNTAPPPTVQPQDNPIDPHTDLPMPIEHLQLPTTRGDVGSPQFSRSARPAQPKGWGNGGQAGDPWRNNAMPPGASPMRQQATSSEDIPTMPSKSTPGHGALPAGQARLRAPDGDPSGTPMASSRPYQATPSASQSGSIANREPVAFDEEHYRVVYNEFVGSKARLGEAVDNITFEGFSSKLRSSEKELIDRHGCKAVRFQVLVKDRQVSLRPQLVR
jgi:hypothetical protein